MPRILSNPEFNQFTQDEASVIQTLENQPGPMQDPAGGSYGQSKVVNWNGMSVLIYLGPAVIDSGDGTQWSNVYLSDVTDASQLQAITQPGYSSPPQTMLDTLPQATIDTIAADAAALGKLLNPLGQIPKILTDNLVPIVVAVALLAFLFLRR